MHWYRNIFSQVSSTKVREIAAARLNAIHAGEDIAGFCVEKTKSPAEAGDLAFKRWTLAVLSASLPP